MKKLILIFILVLSSNAWSDESDLYDFLWLDPDKQVYVLQNKVYEKKGTFYFDVGLVKGMSNDFQDVIGFQGRLGYFLKEEWAVEALFNKYSPSNNRTYDNLKALNNGEPFVRRILQSQALLLVWSPFYGKINTFNKIFYFDWSFAIGPALIKSESNVNTVANVALSGVYEDESYTGAIFKTGLKFYINKRFHVGLEFMNTHYYAPGPQNTSKDILRADSDVLLSVGISF